MAVLQRTPARDLFESLLDDGIMRPFLSGARMGGLLRAPEADVVETEKELVVELDTPGMRPEDIEIGLENNVLTINGERRPQWREDEEVRATWHLSERRYGKFSRSFVLPREVDSERIEARFDNGVLSIRIPKSERARRRRIEIQSGGNPQQLEVGSGG